MHPSTAALAEPVVHSQMAECTGGSAKSAVVPKSFGLLELGEKRGAELAVKRE